ncbi:MAG: hypothetical protein C4334_05955 [Pyrinomonas sp.]|uniref:polymorphic toxin type 44 domain-containing protein n=1 Tax=Pyrinomonas sp. TaxID=2080306 RepID=UPI00332FE2A3
MTVRVTADGGVSEVSPPLSNEAVVTTSGTVVDSASGEEAGKASKVGEQQLYSAQMRQRVEQSEVSYARFDVTLEYMFNEMVTNARSDTVKQIKAHLDRASDLLHPRGFWEQVSAAFAQAGGESVADHITAALVLWGLKVRPGGDWDHKPKLAKMLGLDKEGDHHFPLRGDNQHEVYYDIWSNIHYGYVGRAAGFDAETLQQGAAVADGVAGRNDSMDVLTVQIGIELWNRYGDQLTKEQLHHEVISRLPEMLKVQDSPEYIKANGKRFKHVIDKKSEGWNGR